MAWVISVRDRAGKVGDLQLRVRGLGEIGCQPAPALLKSALMQPPFTRQTTRLKPALAGLMTGLVLWLALIASSDLLHHQFHGHDLDGPSPCAICSVVRGHIDAPTPASPEAAVALGVAWTLPRLESGMPHPVDGAVDSTRGPPAPLSSPS
jgi:hypothetical protein